MGCWDLCSLLCCPPIPSRIAAKLAFLPPDPPTYQFVQDHDNHTVLAFVRNNDNGTADDFGGHRGVGNQNNNRYDNSTAALRDGSDPSYSVFRPPKSIIIEPIILRTRRKNKIGAYFLYRMGSRVQETITLLYSHGNASDIGQMVQPLCYLSNALAINVFIYDYSGYGVSSGRPTEKNCYADVDAAWDCLREQYKIPASLIIPYGQSIGSGPSVYIASKWSPAKEGKDKKRCGGGRDNDRIKALILHSPLMSGIRVLFPNEKTTYCCDIFPNIDRIQKLSPSVDVMLIHGTDDDVVHHVHSLTLYDACPNPYRPVWVEGAGHNDIELFPEYILEVRGFVDHIRARLSDADGIASHGSNNSSSKNTVTLPPATNSVNAT